MNALDDIVVLDLSHALAGPFASTMLGDYGAEIVKIEPLDGEIARHWGPPFYADEAAYFVNLNRNKRSVALDLKHPDGKAIFLRLLAGADVVLENLRVGTVAKLGIDYARAFLPGKDRYLVDTAEFQALKAKVMALPPPPKPAPAPSAPSSGR